MSERSPKVSGVDLVKILAHYGFEVIRIRGSHYNLRDKSGVRLVVPVHGTEEIGPGLLSKILKDASLTNDDIRKYL